MIWLWFRLSGKVFCWCDWYVVFPTRQQDAVAAIIPIE